MALRSSHGIVWPGGHHIVYGMAWWVSHGIWLYGIWLWPGRQGMGLGIVCSIAWRAWHGIWYGLAGKEWFMVWPGAHGMIYGMARRSWLDICYGLAGIMEYGMAWRTSHGIWYGLFWDRYLDIYSYCVLSVDQAFVIANTCKYQVWQ